MCFYKICVRFVLFYFSISDYEAKKKELKKIKLEKGQLQIKDFPSIFFCLSGVESRGKQPSLQPLAEDFYLFYFNG